MISDRMQADWASVRGLSDRQLEGMKDMAMREVEQRMPEILKIFRRKSALDPAKIRLTPIDEAALDAFRAGFSAPQCGVASDRPHFDFAHGAPHRDDAGFHFSVREGEEVYDYPSGNASRFDVAIWYDGKLCGLSCGNVCNIYGNSGIECHFQEGRSAPDGNPLKGLIRYLVHAVMFETSTRLGLDELRQIDPLPGPDKLYQAMGFRGARRPAPVSGSGRA